MRKSLLYLSLHVFLPLPQEGGTDSDTEHVVMHSPFIQGGDGTDSAHSQDKSSVEGDQQGRRGGGGEGGRVGL